MDSGEVEVVQERRVTAPFLPAYTAMFLCKSYLWLVPYWLFYLFIDLIKAHLLEQGVSVLDWIFMVLWIPAEALAIYFGLRMIKIANPLNTWCYVICQIIAIFFEIYFLLLSATVLFLEYFLHLITLIILALELLLTIVSGFINNRAFKVHTE